MEIFGCDFQTMSNQNPPDDNQNNFCMHSPPTSCNDPTAMDGCNGQVSF